MNRLVMASAWMPNAAGTIEVQHRIWRTHDSEWITDTATRRADDHDQIQSYCVQVFDSLPEAVADFRSRAFDTQPTLLGAAISRILRSARNRVQS